MFVPEYANGMRNPVEAPPVDLSGVGTPEHARALGRPLPREGGPNFDTFATPSSRGGHLAALYADNVNVKDAEGRWVRAPLLLRPDPGGWSGDLGDVSVHLPKILKSDTTISFAIPQGTMATVPSGLPASGVRGSYRAGAVRYEEAFAATDLDYRLTLHGYKEQVILKGRQAPTSLTYDIAASGLTLQPSEGGTIAILSGTEEVGFIPAPIAYDSSPELRDSPLVTSLTDLGGGRYRLDMQLDQAFAEGAMYPITIDPGQAEKYPLRDGYVYRNAADTSYEGSVYLKVGSDYRSFIRFDTAQQQREGRLVYHADLYLYLISQNTRSEATHARQVTDAWPSNLTWNNQPPVGDATYGPSTAAQESWLRLELEKLYQRYIDGTWADRGATLASGDHKTFLSEDAGGNARPVLHLMFNDLPAPPNLLRPLGGTIESESPTLRLDGMPGDPNGDDVLVQYQISDDGKNWHGTPHLLWQSPWTDESSYVVPAGVLFDGQTYYWRARSWDVCQKPDGMCPLTDGAGKVHEQKVSPVRSFTLSLKHFGEDERYAMWSQPLGNDMTLKVNQSNGNLFLDVPLDVLSTPVDDLAISMTYNHQQDGNFGLGEGWDVSAGPASSGRQLPTFLKKMDDEGIKIRFRDGALRYFPHRYGRTYGSTGAGTVKQNEDGTFLYTDPDGGVYTFGAKGTPWKARPASTAHAVAERTAFDYGFNGNDRLTRVTDALGRSVGFTWNEVTGQLEKVRAWDGREWTFEYGGGRVIRITTPASETVRFGYDLQGDVSWVRDGQQVASNKPPWSISYMTDPTGLKRVDTVKAPATREQEHSEQEHWNFDYPTAASSYKGTTAAWSSVTDPRGVLSTIADDYKAIVDFNWAGLPIRIAGPADQNGDWPTTTQFWDSHNNLLCKRSPEANAVRLSCHNADSTRGPLQAEYQYDKRPPYRLLNVTHGAPADGSTARATEEYGYDDAWTFRGLWLEKYSNHSMSGIPAKEEIWTDFDVAWGDGSPSGINTTNNNYWSLRWSGLLRIDAEKPREYSFRVLSSDGVTLTVGNSTLLDCFGQTISAEKSNCGTDKDVTKKLWPGDKPISIEYQEREGNASFTLKWDQGNGNWEVIPPSVLEPNLGLLTTSTGPVSQTTYTYPDDDAKARRLPQTETTTDLKGLSPRRQATYDYDEYGRVTKVTDSFGKSRTSTYIGACLTKTVDRTGAEVRYECNGAGDVTKVTTVVRSVPGEAGQPGQPEQQRVTQTTYDAMGRVDTVKMGTATSLHLVTDNDYDLAGRLRFVRDARGNTTENQYDLRGRLETELLPDPDGAGNLTRPTVTHAYDEVGNRTSTTDARGHVWQTEYDALNRVVATKDPLCYIHGDADPRCGLIATRYSLPQRTVTVTDAPGVQTVTTSDLLGRKISEKVGTLPPATYEYDIVGNLTKETDPAGVWVSRTYDGFGEIKTETSPYKDTTAKITNTYDAAGRLITVDGRRTDAADVTRYGYDAQGRITSATLPLPANAETTYKYDDAGEQVRVIDGDGRVRSWTFDVRGRMNGGYDHRGATTHHYDDLSRLVEVRLPTGVTQHFEYDNLGRRTRRYGIKGGQTVDSETFVYDAAGNMVTATNALGAVGMSYDPAGRLEKVTAGGQTTYVYEDARLKSVADPAGQTSFTYNANGQLDTLTDPFGTTSGYGYDEFGRPKSRSTGGLTWTRHYDTAGRIDTQETVSGTNQLAFFDLDYDAAGNVTSKLARVEGWPATEKGRWSYAYDPTDRLERATDPAGVITEYHYDGAGNRTKVKTGGTEVTTAYDWGGHPSSSSDGTDYDTDATGALTKVEKGAKRTDYTYDTWGRLTTAVTPSGTIHYAYDALDRTVRRTKGFETTTFTYQGITEDVATRTVATEPEVTFVASTGATKPVCGELSCAGKPLSIPRPAALQAGDVLLAAVAGEVTAGQAPSGWTAVRTDGDAGWRQSLFYRVVSDPSSEPTNYAFTFSDLEEAQGAIAAYRRAKSSAPVSGSTGQWGLNSSEIRAPSANAASRGVVLFAGGIRATAAISSPAGMTERKEVAGARTTLEIADMPAPNGATGDKMAISTASGMNAGQLLVLAPIPAGEATTSVVTSYAHSLSGPLGEKTGDQIRYYVRDLHDDVVGVVDKSGNSKGSVAYSPWGERRQPLGELSLLGYQGQPTDADTGLTDMTTRLYDPGLGRFTTRDVLTGTPNLPMTYNQFIYGSDSPVVNIDHLGLCDPSSPYTSDPCDQPAFTGRSSGSLPGSTLGSSGSRSSNNLDAISSGVTTPYSPPRPRTGPPVRRQTGSIDLPLRDFIRMDLSARIRWLNRFVDKYHLGDWFNAIKAVLLVMREEHVNSPWFLTADAAILHAMQNGMAMSLGKRGTGRNPAARRWQMFFEALRSSAGYPLLGQLWGQAEQKATYFGVDLAYRRTGEGVWGMHPGGYISRAAFLYYTDVYRLGVRDGLMLATLDVSAYKPGVEFALDLSESVGGAI